MDKMRGGHEQQHRVGVVTVTYNSGKVIDEFLKSLLAQTHVDFILYAVDNASSDDTLTRLSSFPDWVVVVPNQQNLGFAGGTNIGIHAALEAGCQSVLVINNDTAFEPQLIEKLVAGLSEHSCHMTVPKILFYDHPDKIWAAGGTYRYCGGFGPGTSAAVRPTVVSSISQNGLPLLLFAARSSHLTYFGLSAAWIRDTLCIVKIWTSWIAPGKQT